MAVDKEKNKVFSVESKTIYDADDISKLLGCKKSKAYNVIRDLNKELLDMGSKINLGKIPAKYFHNRYKGFLKNEGINNV